MSCTCFELSTSRSNTVKPATKSDQIFAKACLFSNLNSSRKCNLHTTQYKPLRLKCRWIPWIFFCGTWEVTLSWFQISKQLRQSAHCKSNWEISTKVAYASCRICSASSWSERGGAWPISAWNRTLWRSNFRCSIICSFCDSLTSSTFAASGTTSTYLDKNSNLYHNFS